MRAVTALNGVGEIFFSMPDKKTQLVNDVLVKAKELVAGAGSKKRISPQRLITTKRGSQGKSSTRP